MVFERASAAIFSASTTRASRASRDHFAPSSSSRKRSTSSRSADTSDRAAATGDDVSLSSNSRRIATSKTPSAPESSSASTVFTPLVTSPSSNAPSRTFGESTTSPSLESLDNSNVTFAGVPGGANPSVASRVAADAVSSRASSTASTASTSVSSSSFDSPSPSTTVTDPSSGPVRVSSVFSSVSVAAAAAVVVVESNAARKFTFTLSPAPLVASSLATPSTTLARAFELPDRSSAIARVAASPVVVESVVVASSSTSRVVVFVVVLVVSRRARARLDGTGERARNACAAASARDALSSTVASMGARLARVSD